MIYLLYGVVICGATLLGAFVGLGGGVIIKPVLDVIHAHSPEQIALFSSCAVFSMSVAATAQHIKKKTPIDRRIVLLVAAGSILGGFLGNRLFHFTLSASDTPNTVTGIQSVLLCVLLLFVVVSVNVPFKRMQLKNPVAVFLSGLLLGLLAAFLGIGGGPINVAALTLLFSFSMRDAAVYSVAIIFFSQLSNLITTAVQIDFQGYDWRVLPIIIPCAVLGGLLGAALNRKCSEKAIRCVFSVTVFAVACLACYNAVCAF